MFNLLSRILSVDGWVIKLPAMSRRLILRDLWPECSDRLMCSWKVFIILIKRMLELFCRLLFNQRRVVKLYELFGREVSCISRSICFDELFKLCDWDLSVECGIIKLLDMSRRLLLRDHWPGFSDGCLPSR